MGRHKIAIEFIQSNHNRRATFQKRKQSLFKKAYELSELTGCEVMVVVVGERSEVYSYASPMLQPVLEEEKNRKMFEECGWGVLGKMQQRISAAHSSDSQAICAPNALLSATPRTTDFGPIPPTATTTTATTTRIITPTPVAVTAVPTTVTLTGATTATTLPAVTATTAPGDTNSELEKLEELFREHFILEDEYKARKVILLEQQQQQQQQKEQQQHIDWTVRYNPASPFSNSLSIKSLVHSFNVGTVASSVTFSPDGQQLAVGKKEAVNIYEVTTGRLQRELPVGYAPTDSSDTNYVRAVRFAHNNKAIATGSEDGKARLLDVDSGDIMQSFVSNNAGIYSLDISKNGNLLVTGHGDKTAKIWDIQTGQLLHTLGTEVTGPRDGVTSVSFAPDGKLVAAGSLDCVIRLWDAESGNFLQQCEGHTDSVYGIAFSPDGRAVASCSLDKTIKLWQLAPGDARGLCKMTMTPGHKDFVLSIAFSPCGRYLLSSSKDKSVHVWDVKTGTTNAILQAHKNSVIGVAVTDATNITLHESDSSNYSNNISNNNNSGQKLLIATVGGDMTANVWSAHVKSSTSD